MDLITSRSDFEMLLPALTYQQARNAVTETFNNIYSSFSPENMTSHGYLKQPKSSLVLMLIQQLFVQILTKRLMQLMTTEAVILNRNKIPYSYLVSYLTYQAHFSLKDTITNSYRAFKSSVL